MANTGSPACAANRHGPRPAVNCKRSAVAATSLLDARGVRRSRSPWMHSPTPVHGKHGSGGTGQPNRQKIAVRPAGVGVQCLCEAAGDVHG